MKNNVSKKYNKLKKNLAGLESVAIAFSGGVDSTFLLKVAIDELGSENVLAVTSSAETYPEEQLKEAKELAEEINAEHYITYTSELDNDNFTQNDQMRCYYCKKELFSELREIADEKGYNNIADGSNYDDELSDYRPGLKAAEELSVRSPLREAELTKEEIRQLSKKLGLSTWEKPSFACLSSRFPYGDKINKENLEMVDQAEAYLREFDFGQLRLRHHDSNTARIDVLPKDMEKLLDYRTEIVKKLKEIGYTYITMDIEGYRTGSMNEVL